MSSKVRVVARVHSKSDTNAYGIHNDNRDLEIKETRDGSKKTFFSFSRIYKGETLDMFNDEIKNVLTTESAHCFIAYGPTNSGKTHTIWGDKDLPGFLPLAIRHLLGCASLVEVSAIELYKFEYRDLMSPILTGGAPFFEYTTGHWIDCNRAKLSLENSDRLLGEIKAKLTRANNGENAASSRGHCFVFLDAVVGNSSKRFCFVDLAGLETGEINEVRNSKSNDAIIVEGRIINKQLSALSTVIKQLKDRVKHVIYRSDPLTKVLHTFFEMKAVTMVTCLQIFFDDKVINRNLSAIRVAVTAKEIKKTVAARVQVDEEKRVIEDIFVRIREVVLFCRSDQATLDKVSDDLVAILRDFNGLQGIQPQDQQHVLADVVPAVAAPAIVSPAIAAPAVAAQTVAAQAVAAPDIVSPAIAAQAVAAPAIISPAIISPAIAAPAVAAPAIISPAIISPAIAAPAIVSPAIVSPAIVSPAIAAQAVAAPAIISPAIAAPAIAAQVVVSEVERKVLTFTLNDLVTKKNKSDHGAHFTEEEMTLLCLLVGHFKRIGKQVKWRWVGSYFEKRSDDALNCKWKRLQKTKNLVEIRCRERGNQLLDEAIASRFFDFPE